MKKNIKILSMMLIMSSGSGYTKDSGMFKDHKTAKSICRSLFAAVKKAHDKTILASKIVLAGGKRKYCNRLYKKISVTENYLYSFPWGKSWDITGRFDKIIVAKERGLRR